MGGKKISLFTAFCNHCFLYYFSEHHHYIEHLFSSFMFVYFQILVFVNETSVFLNKTVNSSTHGYQLANLLPGHSYSISVAAMSKMGMGPSSQPIRLQTDPALLNPLANRHAGTEGVVGEAWFIILVGGAMFFFLFVLVILLYIRRHHNKTSKLPTINGK